MGSNQPWRWPTKRSWTARRDGDLGREWEYRRRQRRCTVLSRHCRVIQICLPGCCCCCCCWARARAGRRERGQGARAGGERERERERESRRRACRREREQTACARPGPTSTIVLQRGKVKWGGEADFSCVRPKTLPAFKPNAVLHVQSK